MQKSELAIKLTLLSPLVRSRIAQDFVPPVRCNLNETPDRSLNLSKYFARVVAVREQHGSLVQAELPLGASGQAKVYAREMRAVSTFSNLTFGNIFQIKRAG